MDEKEEIQVSSQRSRANVTIVCLELCFIITISAIVLASDNDCDRPIRLWLSGLAIVYAAHSVIIILTEVVFGLC
jgi:hypothetical protein